DDPDRLARFEREAQALAAINHPNIAAIYGLEDARHADESHVRALVLELVEGETLAERISRGPVPTNEALTIAKQIAAALEAAHEQGIVHRDLKPANIKITPEGAVKVLDFGLAKLVEGPPKGGPYVRPGSGADQQQTISASMSPTITTPALTTGAGVLLGTAAYMSPEQARGRAADKRADIWSFGVVLYEMLTGSRAFGGDTVTETAGAVIHKELDWSVLPADLPLSARTIVRRCLQKDSTQRVRDMGDVRLALDGAFTPDTSATTVVTPRIGMGRRIAEIALVSTVLAAIAGTAVWWMTRPQPIARFPIRIDVPMGIIIGPLVTLSPDGRTLAVIGASAAQSEPRIWLYSLETGQSRSLDAAGPVRQPTFWSPDGRSIAYVSDGKLKRIDIAGGPPQTLSDVGNFAGGTWTRENMILFSDPPKGGIMQVPAAGGTAVLRARAPVATKTVAALPWALPDGRHFMYQRVGQANKDGGVFVGSIDVDADKQESNAILTGTSSVVYAPSPDGGTGHLLFLRGTTLMAQGFDERSRTLIGDGVPIVEHVGFANLLGSFAASSNGALAYLHGASETGSLMWVGHDGQPISTIAANVKSISNPRLSPDGRTLAVIVAGDVWAYDVGGRPPIRLTFDGDHFSPLFTRDGRRVVYESTTPRGLFSVPADGSGGMPQQVGPAGHFHPQGWSADGQQIVAVRMADESRPKASPDLMTFGIAKDSQVLPIVETPAAEGSGASVSPDGRWIAYTSDSTGASEIWVRPFPGPGAPIRVSPGGGNEPLWSRNGKELYYHQGPNLMSVAVDAAGAAFNFKPPTRLFESTYQRSQQPPSFDVANDGRFVMIKSDTQSSGAVSVILNWQELLREKNAAH
ncbi:MAG TPA: protein kinase, partial [Vicinamibacterales bacterium]|nr:protein kinase [Vicinamibacterales bacterium]